MRAQFLLHSKHHDRDNFALVSTIGTVPVPGRLSVPHSMHARRSQELEGQGHAALQEQQPKAAPEKTPDCRKFVEKLILQKSGNKIYFGF